MFLCNSCLSCLKMSAWFTTDAFYVLCRFDVATDRIGFKSDFNCTEILDFSAASSASCKWNTKSQLSATLSSSTSRIPMVGDTVIVLKDVLRAECDLALKDIPCSSYATSDIQITQLLQPHEPMFPQISLSMPSEISPCEDLDIDATGSYGAMGHPWLSLVWSVTGDTTQDFDRFSSYLNSNWTSTNNLIKIPNMYLGVQGATYTITLTITNFYMRTSVLSKTVYIITNTNSPKVSILGPSSLLRYRWQNFQLKAKASVILCGRELDGQVSYYWSVYRGYQIDTSIISSSRSETVFKVPDCDLLYD